jgi:hypothetical protein
MFILEAFIYKVKEKKILARILFSMVPLFFGVLVCLFFIPPRVTQSIGDQIANQGLSSFLTEIGVTDPSSLCWLGDPMGRYLKQFVGAREDAWYRWKEKRRVRKWEAESSCFSAETKAIVVLFPLIPDVFALPQKHSTPIQKEVSEVMSQSLRGINLERSNVSFHLESGVDLIVFIVKTPS